jgi:hypothetical protein
MELENLVENFVESSEKEVEGYNKLKEAEKHYNDSIKSYKSSIKKIKDYVGKEFSKVRLKKFFALSEPFFVNVYDRSNIYVEITIGQKVDDDYDDCFMGGLSGPEDITDYFSGFVEKCTSLDVKILSYIDMEEMKYDKSN